MGCEWASCSAVLRTRSRVWAGVNGCEYNPSSFAHLQPCIGLLRQTCRKRLPPIAPQPRQLLQRAPRCLQVRAGAAATGARCAEMRVRCAEIRARYAEMQGRCAGFAAAVEESDAFSACPQRLAGRRVGCHDCGQCPRRPPRNVPAGCRLHGGGGAGPRSYLGRLEPGDDWLAKKELGLAERRAGLDPRRGLAQQGRGGEQEVGAGRVEACAQGVDWV